MTRPKTAARTGPLVGAHVSIAGGIDKAPERGRRLGCRAIQIFTRPASRWDAPPLTSDTCQAFVDAVSQAELLVTAHAGYLINLASPDRKGWRRSITALIDELQRCARLGIDGLVLHPGAHMGSGEKTGIARVARALVTAHATAEADGVRILLENTAGQGTVLGYRFDQLAAIAARTADRLSVGFCLDTCHAFAAGYDIRTSQGWAHTCDEWEREVGFQRLCLVHVNDSKRGCGQRVDRHELLGHGQIGRLAFRELMADQRFVAIPKIIETPKGDDESNDRRALALLRRYATLGARPRGSRIPR